MSADLWDETQLGNVCEVIAGQSPKSSAYNETGDGLPFYQGKTHFTDRYLAPAATWTTSVTKRALPRDILMSVRAPVGPINEATEEICIGRGLAAIRASSAVDRDFLWYALLWLQPKIVGNAGAVFPSINKNGIEALSLPVPPLEQQQRIVAVLHQAFAALDRARVHAEVNLADAAELFDSALLTTFDELLSSSDMKTLSEMADDFSRGKSRHRPRNDPKLYGGEYPFIQTGDIRRSAGSIREYTQTYNRAGLAQSKLWPIGTVCITIAANIAETGVLGFEGCFPDSVIGMVPNPDRANAYYVEYMLRYFAKELKLQGKGSAQDNINLATFENARFPFPTLEQQVAVVDRLDSIAKEAGTLRANYGQTLADIADLRQSLLHKAFAGDLT